MSDGRKCAVMSCANSVFKTRSPNSRFHELPKDPVSRQKWLRWISNVNHFDPIHFSPKKVYVCSDHFLDEYKLKRKLKQGACPSVCKSRDVEANLERDHVSICSDVSTSSAAEKDLENFQVTSTPQKEAEESHNALTLLPETNNESSSLPVMLLPETTNDSSFSSLNFLPDQDTFELLQDTTQVAPQQVFYVPWNEHENQNNNTSSFTSQKPQQEVPVSSMVVVDFDNNNHGIGWLDGTPPHRTKLPSEDQTVDETIFEAEVESVSIQPKELYYKHRQRTSSSSSSIVPSSRKCVACEERRQLHQFPPVVVNGVVNQENLERCRAWVQNSGCRQLLSTNTSKLNKKFYICSNHFETSQYYNSNRKKLLTTAIPTVFFTDPLSDDAMDSYPIWGVGDIFANIQADPSHNTEETREPRDTENGSGLGRDNNGNQPGTEEPIILPPPTIDPSQKKFEDSMNMLERKTCPKCKETFMASKALKKKTCCHTKPLCATLSEANNMDPGEVPEELKCLTAIEEQLIARVHPLISVYKLKKGQQLSYSGNVINFSQDVKTFAKKLPHNINDLSSMITIRTRKDEIEFKDFQVRAGIVERALKWLQANNPFYFDVQISSPNLALLPEDGNFYDVVKSIEVEDDITEEPVIPEQDVEHQEIVVEEVDESLDLEQEGTQPGDVVQDIAESGVPMISVSKTTEVADSILGWPDMSKDAIDEFNTIGYVVQAFPCLFPYGKCDLRSPREKKVSETVFFQHLMRFHDDRFARHARFRFFCLNSILRWTALRDGRIFVKRHPEYKTMTVAQLKKKLEEEPGLVKQIMYQGNNLRGTKPFWHVRGKELQAMMEQLGPPTVFVTLSAADMHWPELFKLLAPDEDITLLNAFKRNLLIQENPLIVDEFFLTRCETFLAEVLTPKYKIKDHWFRIEYQHRGSPHLHGVLWLEGAPDISNIGTASEEEKDKVVTYFDDLISTVHPNVNQRPADVHPCRVRLSEVIDMEKDLAELLNKVQRHTKCTAGYCIRKDKKTQQSKCRFGFPLPLCEKTFLDCTDASNVQLITKRNDNRLNKYNQYVIQTWRGNIDLSPVLSIRALVNYLAKYISKSETKSNQLRDLVKTILDNSDQDKPATHALQRIFIKTCSERDFSAQEACHILMGLKLVSSGGRKFVSINFKENQNWLQVVENPNRKEPKSFPQKYKDREENLATLSMWQMAKQYNISNAHRRNIVQVFPKHSFNANTEDNERFYKQQCVLFVPWQGNEETLLEGRNSWKEVYEENVNSIKSQRAQTELLSTPNTEEELDHELEAGYPLEEWMALSRMTNNQAVETVDLGLRECDLTKNWHEVLSQYEELGGLPYLQTFLQKSKDSYIPEHVARQQDTIAWSPEQQTAIDLVKDQIATLKGASNARLPPKKVIIQGKAGTGKSLLINEITKMIESEFGLDSMKILGPTGVSAVNIGGATIHSALKINCKNKEYMPLQGPAIHDFQRSFDNVKFIILDEFSMVGCGLLFIIDQRLKQAKENNEDFGGLNIFLLGDIKQLAPVADSPAYNSNQESSEYQKGKGLYDSFEASIILKKIHRQKDESFLRVLENISLGQVTMEDYKLLETRFTTSVSSTEREQFQDVLHLYPRRKMVAEHNKNKLELSKGHFRAAVPVVKVPAEHNCQAAKEGSEDDAEGLEAVLYMAENATIMLRSNLWTAQGLVNGAMGKVVHILFHPDSNPSYDPPAVIICQFDTYKGPYFCTEKKTVPIVPVTRQWKNKDMVNCTRSQFPICLAYASTIHKSQGLTLEKVFVDIGTQEKPGLSYVALSRVKTLEGLLLQPFPYKRLQTLSKSHPIKERRRWETQLQKKTYQSEPRCMP